MSAWDLTLDEKTNGAVTRAREIVAEKHFFDASKPHGPRGFSVIRRNPYHWDIVAAEVPGRASAWLHAHPGGQTSEKDGDRARAFRIRGEPGDIIVFDERWDPYRPHPREALRFKSVFAAMLWIADEMMHEPAAAAEMRHG